MSQQPVDFSYRRPLDGLRGLGVLAVVAFHFDALKGGYLGVDLFFVLSGFLITSLLIRESIRTRTISLRGFWERRARRLLPALFVLLLSGALYAATIATDAELGPIRRDGLAGLFYVSNWVQIGANADYFDRFGTPSIFRHLWSLAIEEQFYLLWPLIAGAVLRFAKRPVRTLGAVSFCGGTASMCAAIWMHGTGRSIDRLYFGTDTRVGAILIGAGVACLAYLTQTTSLVAPHPTQRIRGVDLGSVTVRTAGAGVAFAILIFCWFALPGKSDLLWQGGLALCSICAAVLVGIMGHEDPGPLGKLLSIAPLVWFGKISYGLYLWHWPVRVVLDAKTIGQTGVVLFVVRFVVSIALAAASFRWIEQPIRRGGSLRRGRSAAAPTRRTRLPRWAKVGVVAIAASAVVAAALVLTTAQPVVSTQTSKVLEEAMREAKEGGWSRPAAGPPLIETTEDLRVTVMGDSVGVGIAAGMSQLASERGFESRTEAVIGCPLAFERGRNKTTEGWNVDDPKCSKVLDRFDEAVREFSPNLVIAVFGLGNDFDRELPNGELSNPCEPAYDAWKIATWKRFMTHVREAGVPLAVATAVYFGLPGVPKSVDRQTDCLNASMRAAAAQTGTRVLELGTWACPNGQPCMSKLGGVTLRPDGLHFNEQLTPVVANWILSQVVGDWQVDAFNAKDSSD